MIRITAILTATTALVLASAALANGTKPNIVVFISDDHGYLDSSLAGARDFRTPNLDRLAKAGTTFTRAFATSPSCAPSRASLLTGLMPMRSGAMLNHQPPRDDVKKLPAYLHELGYEVAAIGKVAHYKQGKEYGFDHVSHDTFHNDKCVEAAIEFLKNRRSERPLCLLVGTNWPHVPWPKNAPESDAGDTNAIDGAGLLLPPTHVDTPETRSSRAKYASAVARFDRDLGLVYNAAYETLGSNTLFVHFSDHGAQWPFGKWNLYDAGVRVTFVAAWPGVIRGGSATDAMISLVDVLPTLVETAAGTPPTSVDGQSFAEVLQGTKTTHRDRIFSTHSGDQKMNAYPMRSVRTPEWKYIRNLIPTHEHTTHIDRGKSVDGNLYWKSWVEKAKADATAATIVARYRHRPAEELYDLSADPFEQHNLAADARHRTTLRELRSELDAWMRQQNDEGVATERSLQAESN